MRERVFHARLFHSYREHDDFWNQIFHKVVWQHVQGVLVSLLITLLQIF